MGEPGQGKVAQPENRHQHQRWGNVPDTPSSGGDVEGGLGKPLQVTARECT